MAAEDRIEVKNNEAAHRFEIEVNGALAVLEYERGEGRTILIHTDVPEAAAGRGIAGRLAQTALEDARARNLKVVPRCEFVAAYIQRHPQYQSLVEDGGRAE